ncbi:MAG: calcium-binding protein [Pseudomonadota bacterium]
MLKLWQIGVISASMGVALPAVAQMAQTPPETRSGVEARVKERLGKLDANKDGTVSPEEMRAFADARMKEHADERFAAMDTNKDGAISRAEFDAYRAKEHNMDERIVRIERHEGPDGAMMPPPGKPDGHKRIERMRIMMHGQDGMVMAQGEGKGIVIADAVKRALERFDATDTNKDGTISPEERKAAREAFRVKMRTMMPLAPPAPPKAG